MPPQASNIEGPLGRAHRRPSVHARHTAADRRKETCKAKSATVGGRYHEDMHARLLFLQIVSRTLNYSITIMRGAFLELAFLMQTRSLMLTRILIERKHAGSTILKTYDSKSESRHTKYEIWVLQLAFFMQIGIGGNEIQVFVDHDPSVTGF